LISKTQPKSDFKIFKEIYFKSWDELKKFYYQFFKPKENSREFKTICEKYEINEFPIYNGKRIWIFRGHDNLESTLERVLIKYNIPFEKAWKIEQFILNEFKRQSKNYLSTLPEEDDNIAWLSILRHFEGPTRLLDFTYSFFNAVHFALRGPSECPATIWAIESCWLTHCASIILGIPEDSQPGKNFKKYNKKIFPKSQDLE